MDLQLKDKIALVTGSTTGIGFATARSLAAEGAKVIVNGRTRERVNATIEKLRSETGNRDIFGAVADLKQPDQVNALIEQYPSVNILVNNAGVAQPKAFKNIPDEEWLDIYQMNVRDRQPGDLYRQSTLSSYQRRGTSCGRWGDKIGILTNMPSAFLRPSYNCFFFRIMLRKAGVMPR